jgi:hypothetical protein
MAHDIREFFAGKPTQKALFQHVRKAVEALGPVTMKVTKSQISFAHDRQFAWVWLPKTWDRKRPPHSLVLSFSLPKRAGHPRIVEIVEPYPGRFMHHAILTTESDVDRELKELLSDSFAFAQRKQAGRTG